MGVGCAVRASCPSPSLLQPHQMGQNITSLLFFLFPATTGASCPRSNAIGTQEMLGAAPAPCMRTDSPGTLCPKLEPLSHPELSIEGCREQVSKATAVNTAQPSLGLYKPSRFRGWMTSLPLFLTLGLCLQRAPITLKYSRPRWDAKGLHHGATPGTTGSISQRQPCQGLGAVNEIPVSGSELHTEGLCGLGFSNKSPSINPLEQGGGAGSCGFIPSPIHTG